MSDHRTENAIGRVRQAARLVNGKARRRIGRTDDRTRPMPQPAKGKVEIVADVARERPSAA
jgi:hypothetical protein